jgi:hypothetical protein
MLRRMLRALEIFARSPYTWPTCWRQAKPLGPEYVEPREDGLYIRPTPAPKS